MSVKISSKFCFYCTPHGEWQQFDILIIGVSRLECVKNAISNHYLSTSQLEVTTAQHSGSICPYLYLPNRFSAQEC